MSIVITQIAANFVNVIKIWIEQTFRSSSTPIFTFTAMQTIQVLLLQIALWGTVAFDLLPLHPDSMRYRECEPTNEKCEFWLVIKQQLTMIYKKDLVYAHEGKLYLYNEHPSDYKTEVGSYYFRHTLHKHSLGDKVSPFISYFD